MRALVRLAERWVVLVPAGLVVKDHIALLDPMLFRREKSLEDMLYMACEMMLVRGMARTGDSIVFVAGVPPGISRTTNVMKLHRIGEEIKMH